MGTCVRTCAHDHTFTRVRAHIHPHRHTYTRTHVHMYIRTHVHTRAHVRMRAHTHACTLPRISIMHALYKGPRNRRSLCGTLMFSEHLQFPNPMLQRRAHGYNAREPTRSWRLNIIATHALQLANPQHRTSRTNWHYNEPTTGQLNGALGRRELMNRGHAETQGTNRDLRSRCVACTYVTATYRTATRPQGYPWRICPRNSKM
jgi:hypothetical protein